MRHQLTAGAQRALAEAAGWSSRKGCDELEAPALLLGLLAESECRAAITLRQHGIDAQAVRRRWPTIGRVETRAPRETGACTRAAAGEGIALPPLAVELEQSLAAMLARLHDAPRPPVLATEHLLLGLAAAEHEVALWLRQQGVTPDPLETEIRGRYQLQPATAPESLRQAAAPTVADRLEDDWRSERTVSRQAPTADASQASTRRSPSASSEIPPADHLPTLRVLDAALNRAREGLRVVEDYVRFVLDDTHLTDQMKRLRHDLAAALSGVSIGRRLAARETRADVGTSVATPSESRREDPRGVLAANFTRLQESLRTLEEYGKILDPDLAVAVEQLRYRSYTLQRAVGITTDSLERLRRARLYVLIDGGPSAEQFTTMVRSLVDAGVHALQLRDKRLNDRQLLDRARRLRKLTRGTDTLFLVNDRADVAALSGADGVHVGQEELAVKDARTIVGPDALVGVSTHSIEQARQAVLDGANYLGAGPVFPSGTKPFDAFPGPDLLRAVAAEIRLPAFAIGGITLKNLPEVLSTGFRRIAVSGAVGTAPDPAAAARELLAALDAP
jgi:thiamine-phosphate pyrophosphorylase